MLGFFFSARCILSAYSASPRLEAKIWCDVNSSLWTEIVDGQQRGLAARCIRPLLLALSIFYRLAVWTRNKAYDLGVFSIRRLPHPVISIGNIVAGGAGKTPCVRFLAAEFEKRGVRAAVLSRGYGAGKRPRRYPLLVSDGARILCPAAEAGDEPVMLAKGLSSSIVVVDPDRFRGGVAASREFAVDCFILDDGFQHRKLHRDIDILLLDCDRPFGNGRLLPAGWLREPVKNISRAGILIVTRCGSAPPKELMEEIEAVNPRAAIFNARHRPSQLVEIESGTSHNPGVLSGKRIAALSAIARPDDFENTLLSLGAVLAFKRAFPDHHSFDRREIDGIVEEALRLGAEAIVTTAKDAVRLPAMPGSHIPFFYLDVEMEIVGGGDKLIESVLALIGRREE
jgi:tetraacyldisaccharide 4'-kinase